MEKAAICRYFQKGNCKLRGNCPYVHKREQRAPCKFHMQGYCKFGNNCNFYHAPKQPVGTGEYIQEKEVRKPKQQKPEPQPQREVRPQGESDASRMEKIRAINAMLGVKNELKEVEKPVEVKEQKKQEEPIVNYARRILVSFVDLSKTQDGKENTQRINREVYQKPYMEYLKDLTDATLKEQAPIMRRYQYSFRALSEDGNKFTLKLSPIVDDKEMKLNFDIPERCLELSGSLHPKQLEINNKSIPEYFRHELNWQFQALLKTRSIYDTLKYIENYFEKVCEQVDFILENKRFNEKDLCFEFDGGCEDMDSEEEMAVGQAPKKPALEKQQVPNEVQKPKLEQSGDVQFQKYKDDMAKKEEHKNEEEDGHHQLPKEQEILPDIQLTHVLSVQTLQTNCESLLAEELLVHLLCQCSAMITYIIKAKGRRSLMLMSRIKCNKCKQPITVYTNRHIMLRNNNGRIAEVGCINAKIEEVGAVLWKVNCVCQKVIINDQLSLSGVKKIVKCFDCFRQYFVQYYGLFVDHPELPQQERQRPKLEKQKEVGGMRFKLDSELPNKGACRHYKFSFRWLRFACCGRAFPCDRCHEENTDKHDYDRADVMICGLCSQQLFGQCSEQPYDTNCRRCKKELIKGAEKSGHWQGGKGCRDQTLLSRNDPKKYTGLSKTTPNNRK